ncbi:transporter associated domain-containing protein, partial [Thermocatellispora tengchongensis]
VPDDASYETIGGYVMSALGRIPAAGDEVPVGGGMLAVVRMDGRRVDRVRFVAAAGARTEEVR